MRICPRTRTYKHTQAHTRTHTHSHTLTHTHTHTQEIRSANTKSLEDATQQMALAGEKREEVDSLMEESKVVSE